MDFQLRHDIPEHELPEEWQALLIKQARALHAMLTRVAKTVTAVTTHPDRTPAQVARLHTVLHETEQFLTTLAQQNIGVEQEQAWFQTVGAGLWTFSPHTAQCVHVIGQANAALHANLTAARQYLAAIRRIIEHR